MKFPVRFVGYLESGKRVERKMTVHAKDRYAAMDAARALLGGLAERCIYPAFVFDTPAYRRSSLVRAALAGAGADEV